MRNHLLPFVLSLILAFLLAAAGHAGATSHTLQIGKDTRSYHLYTPRRLAKTPALVLVLHGGGGTGLGVMRQTRQRFNKLAEREGFLVVYPDAIDKLWDMGEGTVSESFDYRRDDMRFFSQMIERITRQHGVDPDRVFATGISRGGQASFALACKRPGLIRAIAPVAMVLPDFLTDDCSRGAPLPLLLIHGTEDPLVPYDGGPITLGRKDRGSVLSAERTIALFARRNRCDGTQQVRTKGAVDVVRRTGCAAPLWLFRVNGGGHTWPSGRGGGIRWITGPVNTDIVAPDEIWRFFSQFR